MRALLLPIVAILLSACAGSSGGGGGGEATAYPATYNAELADKSKYGKLVIASVNFGKPSRAYVLDKEAPIDALIAERLRKAGYEVLPSTLFAEAWREGVRKWGEPFNPTTGKLNGTALTYVMSEVVRILTEKGEVQGIVFTNLEESQIYFSPSGSHVTHFLGVTRKPLTRGGEGVPLDFNWVQGVDAISIYITVFDLKLQKLFEGAGGIDVTETLNLKGADPHWERSKKILENEDFIDEGVTWALRPWITKK
jgi:hypothetical protein